MKSEQYSTNTYSVKRILNLIENKEIAIPEIQRPFVWKSTQVRDLIDSLYRGYPAGYLITWKNHDVKLKDGSTSEGKTILIDGQQRVTALMAALLGAEIINPDYKCTRIRIAFNPEEALKLINDPNADAEIFAVQDSSHLKSPKWLPDISIVFDSHFNDYDFVKKYCETNPGIKDSDFANVLNALKEIQNNQIGVIELARELDINLVTEIFIRINSKGTVLKQSDFVMSKIAADENHEGMSIRKAIDYFAHLAQKPEFIHSMEEDNDFVNSDFFRTMKWMANSKSEVYLPSCDDIIRVAFMREYPRAKLGDLVSLLSGRNFETKKFEETIIADTYSKIKTGTLAFINENNFRGFILTLCGAGFIKKNLINSKMNIDFAYTLLPEIAKRRNFIQCYHTYCSTLVCALCSDRPLFQFS